MGMQWEREGVSAASAVAEQTQNPAAGAAGSTDTGTDPRVFAFQSRSCRRLPTNTAGSSSPSSPPPPPPPLRVLLTFTAPPERGCSSRSAPFAHPAPPRVPQWVQPPQNPSLAPPSTPLPFPAAARPGVLLPSRLKSCTGENKKIRCILEFVPSPASKRSPGWAGLEFRCLALEERGGDGWDGDRDIGTAGMGTGTSPILSWAPEGSGHGGCSTGSL